MSVNIFHVSMLLLFPKIYRNTQEEMGNNHSNEDGSIVAEITSATKTNLIWNEVETAMEMLI